MLQKQQIIGNRVTKTDNLNPLLLQEPNRKPRIYLWMYETGLKQFDTAKVTLQRETIISEMNEKIVNAPNDRVKNKLQNKKARKTLKIEKILREGNLLMRIGEPLALYDQSRAEVSREKLDKYLKSKGYFNGNSKLDIVSRGKNGRRKFVTYEILEGPPHQIDSIFVETADSTLLKVLQRSNSLIKKGANYDQSVLSKERERIDNLLKNNGYYDFSRQYVLFEVDTNKTGNKLNVKTIIRNPANRSRHKVFKLDSIIFTSDAGISSGTEKEISRYNNITYRFFRRIYKKKILDQRIFFHPGQLYSKENTFQTQRQLANLDMFKFINVKYDTTGGRFVANIYTNPLNKYQMSNEIGVTVIQRLPGPFYNFSIKNRNLFKGIEILEFNGRVGIEGVPSASNVEQTLRSREIGANFTLTFPQFILPIGRDFKSKLGQLNPRTQLLLGYTYTNRPEYIRSNINSSLAYSWENKNRTRFSLKLIDVSAINSRIDTTTTQGKSFNDRLLELAQDGNNLIRSFQPSIVSSVSFTTTFNFNRYGTYQNKASYLLLAVENGGSMLRIKPISDFLDKRGLESFQYFRIGADYRHHRPLSRSTHLAYRINIGLAVPYGLDKSNRTLPYEKFYFIGGSNSIRAWRPRRLGPGSFASLRNDGSYDDRLEQQGEVLFESSIELRQKLVGFLSGALFVDMGNIWSIEDDSRQGSVFKLDSFYKEFAIGAGGGLRFDFSFLVLRLDAGVKIYDPARPIGSRFILNSSFNNAPYQPESGNRDAVEPVILNIGIGYPF